METALSSAVLPDPVIHVGSYSALTMIVPPKLQALAPPVTPWCNRLYAYCKITNMSSKSSETVD